MQVKEAGKDTEKVEVKPSAHGPVLAYVFKTMADPYIGKLSIFRIFSGTIKTNSSYCLSGAKTSHKFTNIFRLQGKEQQDVSEATCGDIVAVSKIMDISNDDTILQSDRPFAMEKTFYPNPTLPKAILPVSKGDEEKISGWAFTGLLKKTRH